jgi:hypothetical protein
MIIIAAVGLTRFFMKPSCKYVLISICPCGRDIVSWEAYADASRCAGDSPGYHFQRR